MMRVVLLCVLGVANLLAGAVHAAHAYAQFGDIKYPAGFSHFEWANPKAPKRGEMALVAPTRLTNFDKFNPFTLKGAAPPLLGTLVFETLLTGTMDEPTTAYGLLAEDIEVAEDKLSVTFRLNPHSRFHDGSLVTAADVKHSFDTLMSKAAAPQYRVIFGDVKQNIVSKHTDDTASGTLELERATVNWMLSINEATLPADVRAAGKRTFRLLTIDGEAFEFSDGFTELHTASYKNILAGNGFPLSETKKAIQLVHDIRNMNK